MKTDPGEEHNLAAEHPETVDRMLKSILQWNASLPKDAGDPTHKNSTFKAQSKQRRIDDNPEHADAMAKRGMSAGEIDETKKAQK